MAKMMKFFSRHRQCVPLSGSWDDMAKYYEFWGREADSGWVFRVETDAGLNWRSYGFCAGCHREDLELLSGGVESDTKLQIRAGSDIVYTMEENLTLLSEKAKAFIEKEQIGGIGFIPLPNNPFFIAKPTRFVTPNQTQIEKLMFDGFCNECEIYAEAAGEINTSCFVPPDDENTFFSLKGLNIGPRICEMYCGESVAKRLKKAKLRGLELDELE